jgi:hypothetical protein
MGSLGARAETLKQGKKTIWGPHLLGALAF